MKVTCRCTNLINQEHGHFEKVRKGKFYYLFYCDKCNKMFAIDRDNKGKKIYDYKIDEL